MDSFDGTTCSKHQGHWSRHSKYKDDEGEGSLQYLLNCKNIPFKLAASQSSKYNTTSHPKKHQITNRRIIKESESTQNLSLLSQPSTYQIGKLTHYPFNVDARSWFPMKNGCYVIQEYQDVSYALVYQ